MPWFKSWFDSPYYHVLYQHRDEEEAEHFIDNLLNFLNPVKNASMLDLGCGKGRHSVYLNQKGFMVTGIDLSEKSIEYCSRFENDTLSFFVHDMRKLFRVNDFDYVFNLFTSFGYFETDDEHFHVISNAVLSLKKNGILVIDYMNSDYVKKNLVTNETVVNDGITFNITRAVENGFVVKHIHFNHNSENIHFTENVAALSLEDFKRYLMKANMKITGIFGNYELTEFNPAHSPRLILIAQKQ